jgi:regulator of sigma E protease
MSLFLFAVILVALILVHELGHFLVAKWTGMRVDEFGIGFPPRVASVRFGETLYSLNLLPIGGFVRIYGEDPEETTGDSARAFFRKPKAAQAAVLVAGVVMNALFAWVLFTTALTVGIETAVSAEEASSSARLAVVEVLPESPAAVSGVPLGAAITALSFGDETLTPRSPDAFRAAVERAGTQEIELQYVHRGEEGAVMLSAVSGLIAEETERRALGVALALTDIRALPFHEALVEGGVMTLIGLRDVTMGIASLVRDAVLLEPDLSQVAGPVGIVSLVGDASAFGIVALLTFTAFISLNLAVINLLPFPALDGGRLLFVAYEALTRRAIPMQVAYYANATGFVLLILLMVAITFNDIARLV